MSYPSPSEGMPDVVPNSDMAVLSVVAGVLGLTVLPVIGSVVALITGYMARNEIRESAGTLGGESLATVGLILGWIGVGLTVLGICLLGTGIVAFCLFLFALAAESSSSLWLLFLLV